MVQYWKKAYRVDSTKGRLGGLELFGELDIIGVIRDSRLRRTGHILRQNMEKITRQICLPEGIRPIGGTRAR